MNGSNQFTNRISPIEEIKKLFKSKDVLSRLIVANVVIFIFINLLSLIQYLFNLDQEFIQTYGVNRISYYLSLPSDFGSLLLRPWSIFTYMFVQEEIFHLFFNMLVLHVGGKIFNQFVGSEKMLSVYVLSGLIGAVLYVITFNIFPAFGNIVSSSFAIGASASVLGIFVASATYVPNLNMNLILVGNVKLKYIAIVFIVLDFLNIRNGNAGGHIAHIGGALFGFFFINRLQNNIDYSLFFNSLTKSITALFYTKKENKSPFQSVHKNKRKPVSDEEYLKNKKAKQAEIDSILDKIKKSGYDSLSTLEKQKLFQASKDVD